MNAEQQDNLLKAVADEASKRLTDGKATVPKANSRKIGASDGKWLQFTYNDSAGTARTCMIFLLSGEKYTVTAVAEFRDQDKDDALPWVKNAVESIRALK